MISELLLDRFVAMIAVAAITFVVGGVILNWLTRPPKEAVARPNRAPPSAALISNCSCVGLTHPRPS